MRLHNSAHTFQTKGEQQLVKNFDWKIRKMFCIDSQCHYIGNNKIIALVKDEKCYKIVTIEKNGQTVVLTEC